MKVQAYAIGQGTADWDWTSVCDGVEIQPLDGSFASRELAIANAREVLGNMGFRVEAEDAT